MSFTVSGLLPTETTSVLIPGNIKVVGAGTFENCDTLKSIVFDYGVTSISEQTIHWSSTPDIMLPKTIQTINELAFYNEESILSIKYQESSEYFKTHVKITSHGLLPSWVEIDGYYQDIMCSDGNTVMLADYR